MWVIKAPSKSIRRGSQGVPCSGCTSMCGDIVVNRPGTSSPWCCFRLERQAMRRCHTWNKNDVLRLYSNTQTYTPNKISLKQPTYTFQENTIAPFRFIPLHILYILSFYMQSSCTVRENLINFSNTLRSVHLGIFYEIGNGMTGDKASKNAYTLFPSYTQQDRRCIVNKLNAERGFPGDWGDMMETREKNITNGFL